MISWKLSEKWSFLVRFMKRKVKVREEEEEVISRQQEGNEKVINLNLINRGSLPSPFPIHFKSNQPFL